MDSTLWSIEISVFQTHLSFMQVARTDDGGYSSALFVLARVSASAELTLYGLWTADALANPRDYSVLLWRLDV